MGVKSTVTLSRNSAESKYITYKQEAMVRMLRAQAVLMSDKELEDELERLNDLAWDGEGFDNYLIVSDS